MDIFKKIVGFFSIGDIGSPAKIVGSLLSICAIVAAALNDIVIPALSKLAALFAGGGVPV